MNWSPAMSGLTILSWIVAVILAAAALGNAGTTGTRGGAWRLFLAAIAVAAAGCLLLPFGLGATP